MDPEDMFDLFDYHQDKFETTGLDGSRPSYVGFKNLISCFLGNMI